MATSTATLLSGRYRLDSMIGQGGVGTVWRARDLQLDRDVAVKQLQPGVARDPMAADRFRREATTAASLTHPSLVTIYDVGENDGVGYLVMELVEGPSIKDVLAEAGPLDAGEAAALGHEVAAALAEVHERGLVHRDVKPGNVLLPVDGPPKLVDFGTVHVLGDQAASLTTPGTMLGTIGYVAPEQFDGHDVDPRADVYAVGLLLHECLTGEPTFGTGTIAEMTRRRVVDDVTPPSELHLGVPAGLDAVVTRATRRDPSERYADAETLAAALEPLVPGDAHGRLQALARQYRPAHVAAAAAEPADVETTTMLRRDTDTDGTRAVGPGPVVGAGPEVAPPGPGHTSVLPVGEAEADDDRGASGRGRILLPLLGLALVAVAVAWIGVSGPDTPVPEGDATASEDDGGAGGATMTIAEGQDFDPLAGGEEHPEDVPLAFDGDPATQWETSGYEQPDLGGTKPGVGLWVRAANGETPSRVEIDLAYGGSTLEVYAFDAPPGPDPAAWGEPIGTATEASGTVAFDVPDGTGNVILVWITRVGAVDQGGFPFRGGISEIRLLP